MKKKIKSPFIRSLMLHVFLVTVVITTLYWNASDDKEQVTITLENIFHEAIHSIGIPHQEPVKRKVVTSESVSGESKKEGHSDDHEDQQSSSSDEGPSGGIAPSEMQKYFMELVKRIHQTKQYPKDAQFNEQEGVVQVIIEISPEGKILRSELEKATPFKSLNDAAMVAVQKLGNLPPLPLKPTGLPTSKSIILHIPIHFQLR